MENSSNIQKEDEIDLVELFQMVWCGRKTILKFIIVFGLIGVFVSIFSENEYTGETIVLPQTSSNPNLGGNLGGLAVMAGINISKGDGDEVISPTLYPKIVSSIPFRRALLKTPLSINGIDEKVTYLEYYEKYYKPSFFSSSSLKKYTIGLPKVILNLFKKKQQKKQDSNKLGKVDNFFTKDSIHKVSLFEKSLFDRMHDQIKVDVEDEEEVVIISYSMPEALASAQMAKASQELLQDAIIDLKIKKLKGEVDFIQKRYEEVKQDYIKKQSRLASFQDRNQGLVMLRSQARKDRLQADYNLSFEIYKELAKQLETQKIKLKENTPAFTTIDPVSVPNTNSKPGILASLFIWGFVGFTLSAVIVLSKEFISKLKS